MADTNTYKRWTLNDAVTWFHDAYKTATNHGWILTLTGSVIDTGQGNDLDAFAFAHHPDAQDLPSVWDNTWQVLDTIDTYPGCGQRVYLDDHQRLIDVVFLSPFQPRP